MVTRKNCGFCAYKLQNKDILKKVTQRFLFLFPFFFLFEKQNKILYWHECKSIQLVVGKFDLMLFANFIDGKFDRFVKGNKGCYCLPHSNVN